MAIKSTDRAFGVISVGHLARFRSGEAALRGWGARFAGMGLLTRMVEHIIALKLPTPAGAWAQLRRCFATCPPSFALRRISLAWDCLCACVQEFKGSGVPGFKGSRVKTSTSAAQMLSCSTAQLLSGELSRNPQDCRSRGDAALCEPASPAEPREAAAPENARDCSQDRDRFTNAAAVFRRAAAF